MISSRCLLSLSAFAIGAMTIYGFFALGAQSSTFALSQSGWRSAAELGLLVALILFWLRIFLRKRGRPVLLGSRLWLSQSAFFIGVVGVDLAVQGGLLVSFPFDSLSFLIIYNACILCHAGFWIALFLRRRRKPAPPLAATGNEREASVAVV